MDEDAPTAAGSVSPLARPDPEAGSAEAGIPWTRIVGIPVAILAALLGLWGLALEVGALAPGLLPPLPAGLAGIDLVGVAVVLGLGPPGVHAALAERSRRKLEEQFPHFLTDLAANRKAGFTLAESVRLASQGDYGPLTPHVRRMAAQLSWNIPFEEALERFAHQVGTPLVQRSASLVLEAERTGGHIADILQAVARDAREIKTLDRERRLAMHTYTVVMYVTFLVFLGVLAMLYTQLLPPLLGTEITGDDPVGRLLQSETTLEAQRTFFFTASLVQAVGTGALAGKMAGGRTQPGLLHAAVMGLAAVLTFTLL